MPLVTIWPLEHDGILPLAPGNARAEVSQDGDRLVASLEGQAGYVVSRGGHALSRGLEPVLHLRATFTGGWGLRVWVLAPGAEIGSVTPLERRVLRHGAESAVDLYVPLVPGLGNAAELDKIAIGMAAGAGELSIERLELLPMTPRLWLRCRTDELRSLESREPNVYLLWILLLAGVPVAVLRAGSVLWRRVRGPSWHELVTGRLAMVLVAVVVAAWCARVAGSLGLKAGEVWAVIGSQRGLDPGASRADIMGRAEHARARMIDAHVPSGDAVVLTPWRRGLHTWRLAMAIAPRPIQLLDCGEEPGPERSPWVAAAAGCFEVPMAASPASGDVGPEPWSARIGEGSAGRRVRSLVFELEDGSLETTERIHVTVRAADGKPILEGPLPELPPHTLHLAELPATPLSLHATVFRGKGDGTVRIRRAEARLVPPTHEPVAADARGNLLARRRGESAAAPASPLLPAEETPPSPWEVPRLLLGLAALMGLGEAMLRLLFWGGEGPRGAIRLALAWLLGAGVATLLMYGLSFAGLRPWPALVPVGLLLAGLSWRLGRPTRIVAPRAAAIPMAPDERILAAVAATAFAVALAGAFVVPISEWDELVNWGYRGHLYYHAGPTDGAVAQYAGLSPRHKAYPHGLPLLQALTGHVAGRWDDARSKSSAAIYYGAMVLLLFGAVRSAGTRRLALLYACLGAAAPMALTMSTLGMADLPLGPLLLAAVICVDRWRAEPAEGGWLLTAGLLAALMSWMKLDGGALKLLLIGLAVLKGLLLWRQPVVRRSAHVLGLLLLAFAPVMPWSIVYRRLELKDWVVDNTLDLDHVSTKLVLVPDILKRLADFLFVGGWGAGPHWGATYVLLLGLLLLAPGALLGRRCRLYLLALAVGIAGYAAIYVVSPQGLHQLERSFDRILLHLFPLALAAAGRAHAIAWREGVAGAIAEPSGVGSDGGSGPE